MIFFRTPLRGLLIGRRFPLLNSIHYKTRLGNLAMLEKPINIVAGNSFFADKQLEYAKSGNYLSHRRRG